MDADVLYGLPLLRRLIQSPIANCFLLDRDFEPGPEPVKLCVRDGRLVEFRKGVSPTLRYDDAGDPNNFGFEDITGLPWIEIDFPEDLRRAEEEVLPALSEP